MRLDHRLRGFRRLAPSLVSRSADGLSREVPAARLWAVLLAVCRWCWRALMHGDVARPDLSLRRARAFRPAFAVNSSLHSYLILAYAGSEKAAEDVGFYYAANAAGRLLGILLSGLLYGWGGLVACLMGSAAMLATCWVTTLAFPMHRDAGGARVGPGARVMRD